MKATTSTSSHCPQHRSVHFDRELPVLLSRNAAWERGIVLDRSAPIDRLAAYAARHSQGRFPVELVGLRNTLADFLTDLLFLPGLESILDCTRYSLSVKVGVCFDAMTVAEGVARVVHQHFFESERFDFSPEPKRNKEEQYDDQAA